MGRGLTGNVPSSSPVADGLTRLADVPQCSDVLMPKSAVVGHASRRHGRPRAAKLPDVVEGQIAELCRDLAVEAKRIRQLHEQADELRRVIRQWAAHSKAYTYADTS